MPDLFGLTAAQFETFLLVFIRIVTLLAIYPIFSANQVPVQVRVGLALILSFIVFHAIPLIPVSPGLFELAAAVAAQVVFGLTMGFISTLVFTGVQFAGEVLDLQIGFAVANVVSPQTQEQVTIIGVLELTLASLLYLGTNSHLLLIRGLASSFQLVPLPYIALQPAIAGDLTHFFALAITTIMRIAAPASFALVIVNVALAFMARVAPQMNVFVIGFPIQISIGLIVLAFSMPILGYVLVPAFEQVAREMTTVMRAMHA